jgi:hypothetical protein
VPQIRTIKGVLHNFLGTYTSRYSDFDGYWVFGFLTNLENLTIDLLYKESEAVETSPVSAAIQFARQKFTEQMLKAGLSISLLREASLKITLLNESATGLVNGRTHAGRRMRFQVKALSGNGNGFESSKTIFVAPHDANIEQRSGRAT